MIKNDNSYSPGNVSNPDIQRPSDPLLAETNPADPLLWGITRIAEDMPGLTDLCFVHPIGLSFQYQQKLPVVGLCLDSGNAEQTIGRPELCNGFQ